ncbi:uncharacterized protein N7484_001070, partial [Penicillium longicatenatum]|uniref:uncharacterized protein n=1 Tax=Penicillium longicatenatum TaxID=1561947 RepID=UPI0025490726
PRLSEQSKSFGARGAHVGVPGNKAADQVAKEATRSNLSTRANTKRPPEADSLRTLMATTKSIIRRARRAEWDTA